LSRLVLPPQALTWLSADRSLFATWLTAVDRVFEEAGILSEIVQQADGLSVAGNLDAATETTRLPAQPCATGA